MPDLGDLRAQEAPAQDCEGSRVAGGEESMSRHRSGGVEQLVGGEDAVLKDGGEIRDTQSALVLEDLIGKFLLNSVNNKEPAQ